MAKCYETNANIYIYVCVCVCVCLFCRYDQHQSASGHWLATPLFNRSSRGLLPRLSTLPILCNSDENNHTANQTGNPNQTEADSCIHIPFLPIGSTVALQWKDRGPCVHGTIIGNRSEDHNRRCYKIRVMKTGCIITRTNDMEWKPPYHRWLCQEWDGLSQQTPDRWQTEQSVGIICQNA